MKTKSLPLIAAVALIFCAGCSSFTKPPSDANSVASKIQNILGNILPPDFTGNAHVTEHTPWFTISGTAKNVHKDANGKWTWDAFEYDRSDMFNTGAQITLEPGTAATASTPAGK